MTSFQSALQHHSVQHLMENHQYQCPPPRQVGRYVSTFSSPPASTFTSSSSTSSSQHRHKKHKSSHSHSSRSRFSSRTPSPDPYDIHSFGYMMIDPFVEDEYEGKTDAEIHEPHDSNSGETINDAVTRLIETHTSQSHPNSDLILDLRHKLHLYHERIRHFHARKYAGMKAYKETIQKFEQICNTLQNEKDAIQHQCDAMRQSHAIIYQQLTETRKRIREMEEKVERYTCGVCYEKSREMLFQPCHHVVCCSTCAERVIICPICCHDITASIPIFNA